MKITKLFFLSIIILISVQTNAQNKKLKARITTPEDQIYTSMLSGIMTEGTFNFDALPPEKQSVLFSIIVYIDGLGKVSKVEFTNPSNRADSLIRYEKVSNEIKKDKKKIFNQYKNSIYVLPILITKGGNYSMLITPEFLKDFEKLIPSKDYFERTKSLNILRTHSVTLGDIQY
ncbi:hypothetical protein AY601_0282 [Pedobacter cryoconitis]|uniref:Uncharacterized protein n=1 Tax=Pedobacter cryoconitis TaxID=188932 RepID=A0A127V7R5_9SPHI|nr:hypothetical protein [Pedobacter cryoconitis]AMP97249.1 hypothetical protein AY601_0282 [Pedobacter cryoconitis]